jgi:hypothetical protein
LAGNYLFEETREQLFYMGLDKEETKYWDRELLKKRDMKAGKS